MGPRVAQDITPPSVTRQPDSLLKTPLMPEIVADIPVKMPARPTTSFIPISKPDEKVIPAKTKAPKAHHVPWLAISLACLFTFTMSLAAYFAFKS